MITFLSNFGALPGDILRRKSDGNYYVYLRCFPNMDLLDVESLEEPGKGERHLYKFHEFEKPLYRGEPVRNFRILKRYKAGEPTHLLGYDADSRYVRYYPKDDPDGNMEVITDNGVKYRKLSLSEYFDKYTHPKSETQHRTAIVELLLHRGRKNGDSEN